MSSRPIAALTAALVLALAAQGCGARRADWQQPSSDGGENAPERAPGTPASSPPTDETCKAQSPFEGFAPQRARSSPPASAR